MSKKAVAAMVTATLPKVTSFDATPLCARSNTIGCIISTLVYLREGILSKGTFLLRYLVTAREWPTEMGRTETGTGTGTSKALKSGAYYPHTQPRTQPYSTSISYLHPPP